jgi:hypothetical protein
MKSLQLAGSASLGKNRAFFGVPRLFAGHQLVRKQELRSVCQFMRGDWGVVSAKLC